VDSISASGVKLNIKYPIGATERFKSILTRTKSCKYFIENSIQYFRWIQKTNISNILAIKGVPIHATLIGLIPGLFLHLIDILAPFLIAYLRGKINKAIKQ